MPKKDRVFIEYKYGPLTTLRRGQALKLGKELIEKKRIQKRLRQIPGHPDGKKGWGRQLHCC